MFRTLRKRKEEILLSVNGYSDRGAFGLWLEILSRVSPNMSHVRGKFCKLHRKLPFLHSLPAQLVNYLLTCQRSTFTQNPSVEALNKDQYVCEARREVESTIGSVIREEIEYEETRQDEEERWDLFSGREYREVRHFSAEKEMYKPSVRVSQSLKNR
jgi:hypothetical protein